MELQANTGATGSNGSIWGSGLLASAERLAGTGLEIANIFKGNKTAAAPAPSPVAAAPAPSSPGWTKYLPWALGAVALAAVGWFVMKRK